MTTMIKHEEQKQQLDHYRSLAKIAAESKQYQNMTEASLLNLMLSARDLGISPLKAINGGFYVVNGKVCMSTGLMVDKIRRSGHSIKIVAMNSQKCIIHATRKDNGDTLNLEYTMEDAHAAGLTGSPTWKKYPKIMLYNRCMSTVARILFPDVVGNSYSEEERFDIQNVPPEKRPLEEPEDDITINISSLNEKTGEIIQPSLLAADALDEEQCALLDSLLQDDEEGKQKVLDHLGISSIYEIKVQDFDRVVKSIKKRKALQEIEEKKKNG